MRWLGVAIISCWLVVLAGPALAGSQVNDTYFKKNKSESKFFTIVYFSDHPKRAKVECSLYSHPDRLDSHMIATKESWLQYEITIISGLIHATKLVELHIKIPEKYYKSRRNKLYHRCVLYTWPGAIGSGG